MERQRILERERRWARPAAAAAMLAAPLYVAAIYIDQSGAVPRVGLATERYRAIEASGEAFFAAVAVRGVAFLLLAGALLYLFRAVQARSERVGGAMVGFVFIGPVLLALQGLVAAIAQRRVARDFVAEAEPGGDVFGLLDGLVDESAGLEVASGLLFPAILGMLIGLVYISLQAMRVGLLTRFTGTLGMALGAGLVFIVPAVSLLAIVLWFLWLGLIVIGRIPRPPAWEAGVAIPWPRPGEQPAEAVEEELPPGILEGEGSEVDPSRDGHGDHSARRERARKRKRKGRR